MIQNKNHKLVREHGKVEQLERTWNFELEKTGNLKYPISA